MLLAVVLGSFTSVLSQYRLAMKNVSKTFEFNELLQSKLARKCEFQFLKFQN